MRSFRYVVVALIVLFAFVLPSNGCGPFFESAEFVRTTRPDDRYSDYLKGRIGVPQATYRLRHLAAAYDWMNGHGLTASEQKQMAALDDAINGTDNLAMDSPKMREVPGSQYESYVNCLGDAFQTAERTHQARKAAYANDPASIANWEKGQAAVFSNCTGNQKTLPDAAPANAPLWLKQDRAYQMAAAKFYTADYDGAIADLQGIVADKGSPWRNTARLVIARAMIRRATDNNAPAMQSLATTFWHGGPTNFQQNKDNYLKRRKELLSEARDALRAILADASMREYHATATRLMDYVMLRLDPATQQQVLAKRLMGANRAQTPGLFRQAAIDISYVMGSSERRFGVGLLDETRQETAGSEAFWLQMMKDSRELTDDNTRADVEAHRNIARTAAASWQKTPTVPWLLAAMSVAEPGDPASAEMVKAASEVPESSPAWVAATYYRLRLTIAEPGTRAELDAVMPKIEHGQSLSTINMFKALRQRSSPTLEAFLQDAGTVPAGIDAGFANEEPVAPDAKLRPALCGVRGSQATALLFDHDAATILNTRMTVAMLAEAAESKTLAPNLRYQIAQEAWTRAVLLQQPDIAKRMSPILSGCYAAWKPWLDKYDAASEAQDRQAAGLLAMMRFASTEPIVRDGLERPEGFAGHDEYRDNWWQPSKDAKTTTRGGSAPDAGVKQSTLSWVQDARVAVAAAVQGDTSTTREIFFGTMPESRQEMADPPFVSADQREVAERELAALRNIPCASDYFARAALEWQKEHPADARTPDILGFAQKVIRSGCSSNATSELNHKLFVVTQTKYSKSEWAKRYTTWQ